MAETIQSQYLDKVKNALVSFDLLRRDIIKLGGDAQHHAKRAIFAMHRDDMKEASQKLEEAKIGLLNLEKMAKKDKRTFEEGTYREAVEEYVEAVLFYQFLQKKKMGPIVGVQVEPQVYVAGLCDVPGELYRHAIKAATHKDVETVMRCMEAAEDIIGELIECNLTKYLRTKFDQARQAVGKLEIVVYELSLRNKDV